MRDLDRPLKIKHDVVQRFDLQVLP